jgi:hypothetical protein
MRGLDEGVEDVPALFSRGGYDGSDGAKVRAPAIARKPLEIFILTFIIRRFRSASLLVKGTGKS